MNIGPLLRSMMGDSRPGEPKALELKTGQVVRGTVMSVSDDGQEAVIQVQGVKLHAALETPLRPGETTLLQVQPKTVDGLVVLKPMDSQVATMSTATLAKALEALGMDNTASNRELLQLMQKSGMPLTKDNVSLLLQVSGQKPAGVPLSEWIQSAGIAFSRGLPITAESVAGLHQAVFGPPLHVLLASLEEQIGNLVRASGGEMGLGSNPAAAGLKGSEGSLLAKGQAASLVQISGNGGSEGPAVGGPPTTGSAVLAGQAPASQAAALQDRVSAEILGTQGNLTAAKDSSSALVAKLQTVLAELNASIPQEGMGEGTAASRGASTPGVSTPGETPAAASTAAAAAPAAQGEGPAGPSPGARPTP
ncbi:flagellar hook-length control protein FliK, partial [Paenibacillus puldeungensis]